MALVVNDRVQQTGTANTTVSFTLSGSVVGYQSFAVIGNGNTTFYAATDVSGSWEVGVGTYSTTGPTLTRTTILSSSNSGSAVTFSGTVNVFVTYPSEQSVNLNASGNVSPLGTITSGVWNGSTIPVAYGGTGVTASSGANSVVLRDASQNVTFNNFTANAVAVTAAGGTTILTVASARTQLLVGSTTQTFQLPDATTLVLGQSFIFVNNSSGVLTITDNSGATVELVPSGGITQMGVVSIATSAGTWGPYSFIPAAANWGTNSLALASTVISGGTWQGGTIQPAYGGTGLTTFTGANNALYSTGATTLTAGTLPVAAGGTGQTTAVAAFNALNPMTTTGDIIYEASPTTAARLPIGSTGQILTVAGGIPSWAANAGSTTLTTTDFTATSGQTTFSVTYTPALLQGVYQNGAKLGLADYTATNGTSVVLATGAVTGDLIQVQYFSSLSTTTAVNTISFGSTGLTPSTATAGVVTVAGTLATTNGGTGLTTVGTNGQVLTSNGTTLSYQTPAATGVTSVTGTSPVVSSGGTTPAISMPAATTSVNGYLTSTDWNTFNGKQAAGSYVTVGGALGTPSSGTLTNCTFPTLNQNTTGTAAGLSATLAVASGGTGVTTSTGSGSNVLSTSPTLTTPILGTPTSGNLANCTFPTLNQNTTGSSGSCTGNAATATTATTATTANALNTGNNYQINSLGVGTAANGTAGDIVASRAGGTTGVIFFGTSGGRYLYYDGTNYQMPGGQLDVNSQRVLNAGNYTSYAPSLTGSGASGSWGISVTGSSASCTGNAATVTNGVYTTSQQIAKGWVRYNSVAQTITASYNVSSVTFTTTCRFVINWTTAFADANYCMFGMAGYNNGCNACFFMSTSNVEPTTTQATILCIYGAGNSQQNSVYNMVSAFR
jgi:hypothetical protein